MALTCLDNALALSWKDYPCFTDATRPVNYNVGTSGHSLTDADYGFPFLDNGRIAGWDLLTRARTKAVLQFKTDLSAALRNYNSDANVRFSGFVGKLDASGITTVSSSRSFVGQYRRPKQLRGVKEVIKFLYLGLDLAGDYDVMLRSNDPTFTAIPLTLTANGSSFVKYTPTEPIELPYFSDAVSELEYFLTVELVGGAFPLANKLKCCGNVPEWSQYATIEGMTAADDLGTDIHTNAATSYGLVTESYITCDELGWVCDLEAIQDLDFPDLKARTIQAYATSFIISELIDSNLINLFTMYTLEQQHQRRAQMMGIYATNIDWIAQNLPRNLTDCWECKETNQFYKTSQIV